PLVKKYLAGGGYLDSASTTAQAADETLTLACQGTAQSLVAKVDGPNRLGGIRYGSIRQGAPCAAEPCCHRRAQGHARRPAFRLHIPGLSRRQTDRQKHAVATSEGNRPWQHDRAWLPVELPSLGGRAHHLRPRGGGDGARARHPRRC